MTEPWHTWWPHTVCFSVTLCSFLCLIIVTCICFCVRSTSFEAKMMRQASKTKAKQEERWEMAIKTVYCTHKQPSMQKAIPSHTRLRLTFSYCFNFCCLSVCVASVNFYSVTCDAPAAAAVVLYRLWWLSAQNARHYVLRANWFVVTSLGSVWKSKISLVHVSLIKILCTYRRAEMKQRHEEIRKKYGELLRLLAVCLQSYVADML